MKIMTNDQIREVLTRVKIGQNIAVKTYRVKRPWAGVVEDKEFDPNGALTGVFLIDGQEILYSPGNFLDWRLNGHQIDGVKIIK